MPKARYLAPWQQPDLMEIWKGLEGEELNAEELAALRGKPAIYHCLSRVVDRQFVFGDEEKEQFVTFMRLYEKFCQVRVLSFCVMSNHFHILLEVPSPPEGRGRDWTDEKLLTHLSCLYPKRRMAEIRWQLGLFREQGSTHGAEEYRESFLCRMWDLSQFMKTLKQRFTRWFNKVHGRCGTLWEERFKSVLVEDGHAGRVMAAYIDLNPVRAGIVKDPKDYRWCSYGEAMAGRTRAQEGIQRVLFGTEEDRRGTGKSVEVLQSWRTAEGRYREVLYEDLRRGTTQEGQEPPSQTKGEAIRGRVRQFADGLAIGSNTFINQIFRLTRDRFGPKRKDGARKMRGVSTTLCAMRDLQVRTGQT